MDAARSSWGIESVKHDDTTDAPKLRHDEAYLCIRRDIISCQLWPGQRFTEAELIERYQIGKATCRNALLRLMQDGFVVSQPRRGYYVKPIRVKDVDEVFDLRLELEPMAARLAVNRVDVNKLVRWEKACREECTTLDMADQIKVFLDANKEFHLTIAAASDNRRLYSFMQSLLDEMSRLAALGFGFGRHKPGIRSDHEAMLAAFRNGDAQEAAKIARRHVEVFRAMTMEKILIALRDVSAEIPIAPQGRACRFNQ